MTSVCMIAKSTILFICRHLRVKCIGVYDSIKRIEQKQPVLLIVKA